MREIWVYEDWILVRKCMRHLDQKAYGLRYEYKE